MFERRGLRAVARHRLTHFLILGAVLFAVTPAPEDPRSIRVTREQLTVARAAEARRLGKAALSEDERRAADARVVEDALLYREASRLGLAEGDPIVVQRMTSKLLVLAEDVAGASQPLTEEQLRACHAERNASSVPAEAELVHVFGATRERVEALRTQVEAFSAQHEPGSIPPFGESFPMRRQIVDPVDRIAATYGPAFAAALPTLPVGHWSEPLASKFGWHLVRLTSYGPPGPRTEEGRHELAFDCQLRVRERAVDAYLNGLFVKYDVLVGGEPLKSWTPSRRVAVRSTPSAEDQ